jgi:hypothetical protein
MELGEAKGELSCWVRPFSFWGLGPVAALAGWGVRIWGWKGRNYFDLKGGFRGLPGPQAIDLLEDFLFLP